MKRFVQLTLALLIFIVFGCAMTTHAQTSGSYTVYLPFVAPPLRVLWTEFCDPRTDPDVCGYSDTAILKEFYATLNSIPATIDYTMPQSLEQLRHYDIVIANYCSGLYMSNGTALLSEYLSQGGSIMVLADNSCIVGVDSQGYVSSARAANALTSSRGISFAMYDVSDIRSSNQILAHPVTANVNTIYSYQHAYLQVNLPATPVVMMDSKPLIGVYDGAGTLVAIPNIGFHWGNSFQQVGESDNFVFWRNALLWLAMKSHLKQINR